MKNWKVKTIMVPLADYAVVPDTATLFDAVQTLEQAQEKFKGHYKHRAILVINADKRVIGKVSQSDVLRGLEPGYHNIPPLTEAPHSGLSREILKAMMSDYNLWDRPVEDICKLGKQVKIKDIMYTLADGEFVSENATLDEAIHQLVLGRHQSLLAVNEKRRVVGILRLTDVFSEVLTLLKNCKHD